MAHPIFTEAVKQVCNDSAGPFDRPGRKVLVLEPHGDTGEGGIVPGLAVRQSLIEIADDVGRFVGNCCYYLAGLLLEKARLPEEHGRSQVVTYPDRF